MLYVCCPCGVINDDDKKKFRPPCLFFCQTATGSTGIFLGPSVYKITRYYCAGTVQWGRKWGKMWHWMRDQKTSVECRPTEVTRFGKLFQRQPADGRQPSAANDQR